jgi:hypothetical protein
VRVSAEDLEVRVARWVGLPFYRRAGLYALSGLQTIGRSPGWLASLALLAAALALWIGQARYPAFVPQEGISSLRAASLLDGGLRPAVLPAFYQGLSDLYDLGTSVYLAVVAQAFGPVNLGQVRGLTALLGLLGSGGLGWALWRVRRLHYGWALPAFLACIPLWAYFSRSGVPAGQAASLAACALAAYVAYRGGGREGWLYAAVVLAWLAFYATPAMHLVVPAGVLLRYHAGRPRATLIGLGLSLLLAVPFILFLVENPGVIAAQLGPLHSYWLQPLPFFNRLGQSLGGYLGAFNPILWFSAAPSAAGLSLQPAPLPWILLPLVVIGIWTTLRGWRDWANRLLLAAWLASAASAAFWRPGLDELLAGGCMLAVFGFLGAEKVLSWLAKYIQPLPAWSANLAVLGCLAVLGFTNLQLSLQNGPQWLSKVEDQPNQAAAGEVFSAAAGYARGHPAVQVLVSPDGIDYPDIYQQFFAPGLSNLRIGAPDEFAYQVRDDISQYVFTLAQPAYQSLLDSGKFEGTVLGNLPARGDSSGYVLFSLAYSSDIQAVLQAERDQWHQLTWETVSIDGRLVSVGHSGLDMGSIGNLFDGDPDSLARTALANPFVLDLRFDQPQSIWRVRVRVGSEPVTLKVQVTPAGETQALEFSTHGDQTSGLKDVQVDFAESISAGELRLEVSDDGVAEPGHIHIWEVRLATQP